MNILTFDTSLDKTYVAFSQNGEILSSEVIENHNEKYHSAYLIPVIVSILKKHNLVMQDIDVIGTNIGPGSFTGIRACVTVARVIAQQLNIPLVGVSSLEILSRINKDNKQTILVLDARKKQFYTAVYRDKVELSEPKLANYDDINIVDFTDSCIISDIVGSVALKELGIDSIIYTDCNENLGVILNQIVQEKIKNFSNDTFLWGKMKPLYLQSPPVTLSKKN